MPTVPRQAELNWLDCPVALANALLPIQSFERLEQIVV